MLTLRLAAVVDRSFISFGVDVGVWHPMPNPHHTLTGLFVYWVSPLVAKVCVCVCLCLFDL